LRSANDLAFSSSLALRSAAAFAFASASALALNFASILRFSASIFSRSILALSSIARRSS